MKKSLIYTRTGDKGTTALVGGKRVPKTHARLEAYGTIDELNANLGMLISLIQEEAVKTYLYRIQHFLFDIGAYLATESTQQPADHPSCISEEVIKSLETQIDELDASLPPLTAFILPGGSSAASFCHICRTVCRRTERRILNLEEQLDSEIDMNVKRFINRLSDYLFILSRKLNQIDKQEEIYWSKSCK